MKLKYWKKNNGTAFLSLNDEIWGVLSIRALQRLSPPDQEVEIEQKLGEDLIHQLQNRAWWQITDYLAKAEHSEQQCRNFLARKSYHPSIIEQCIKLCIEKGYLDDARYAEILIRSLLERGKSKSYISQKMYQQNIPPALYESILAELYDPSESQAQLIGQINKLLIRYRDEEAHKAKERIFASLFRKGFCLDEISAAWIAATKPRG
ncbi:MAG: regulatory protein [Candidatus Cloacimonadota bacterium]|jgi:regulatory protein|nr:regulatory protein [Candidatus Cloacimonadota bacterium]